MPRLHYPRRSIAATVTEETFAMHRNYTSGLIKVLVAAIAMLAMAIGAAPASADFGFDSFSAKLETSAGAEATQAGAHPDAQTVTFALNTKPSPYVPIFPAPDGLLENFTVELPAGFIGAPTKAPTCTQLQLLSLPLACPAASQIGYVVLGYSTGAEFLKVQTNPVFNMQPAENQLARFGFNLQTGTPINIVFHIRSKPDYGITASMAPVSSAFPIIQSRLVVWGVPWDASHDADRGPAFHCTGDADDGGSCSGGGSHIGQDPVSFLSDPTSCGAPLTTSMVAHSWEGSMASSSYASASGMAGCDALPFDPSISVRPTSHEADSPTGLKVDLEVPQNENPNGLATAHLKDSLVSLPEGMRINPAGARGLRGCAPTQFDLDDNTTAPACPDASKLGTAEIQSNVIREPLLGTIYQAAQHDNPFGSNLSLYVYTQGAGMAVKLAAEIHTDPNTGQVVTTFDDNPQLPFTHFKLNFNGGPRAVLMTPPSCGHYTSTDELTSWARPGEPITVSSGFDITSGPGGSACPNGTFAPKFEAGSTNPLAGAYSPFVLKLSREDGTQQFTGLTATLPPGLLGRLAGIPYCPDAAIAAAAVATGMSEQAAPSCPAASRVGSVLSTAGAGALPYQVSGSAYLAGPYKGAPLSLAIITPALAGPLDLGTVVVRTALYVDQRTTQIRAVSDPIPHALVVGGDGFPLDLRSIAVTVDRPQFTLNPTSCEATSVTGTATGLAGAGASISNRFQVGGCGDLAFKPKLKVRLKGATGRTGHPALKAVVTYPQAGPNANIARAQVNLPHSEFLDQGNLNKTCTRPVLLAGACPASTIYGRARAFTPLLDRPLEGPVYLVGGYGYKLPALVAELNGQIRVLLVGKVDTGKNKGIRSTFEVVPDAPVSRFVLEMKGGKKYGLLENSEDLCSKRTKRTAIARFTGQNGKVDQYRPKVAASCKKKPRKTRQRRGHARQQKQAHSAAEAKRHNG